MRKTSTDSAVILIRLMTGLVFLSEGIQKFLYPAMRGAGRFEGMGFPAPEFFASFVGVFEVICGLMLLAGFITRGAAFAMLINMTVAIVVTKIPIAFGESFGPFVLRDLKTYGFWSMAHEIRTDLAMWLGALFLIIKGGGRWSVDRVGRSLPQPLQRRGESISQTLPQWRDDLSQFYFGRLSEGGGERSGMR